jgi:hypothetical protein
MLKNGSTFAARMLSAGERVRLRVEIGDIEVRASEIALTGYSLGDLAEQQWAVLHQQQLDKQFPFIDWCTRHHLYDMADTALAQMAEKAQDPPRVAGYQARVKRLREIHQEQQAAAAPPQVAVTQQPAAQYTRPLQLPPPHGSTPPALGTAETAYTFSAPASPQAALAPATVPAPATLLLPAPGLAPASAAARPLQPGPLTPNAVPSGSVQQASYQPLEISREPAAASKGPAITSPNPALLPSAAVEIFTARVQPWVVSRCSICHDSHSTSQFKIERYSKQEAVPRATTLKNLAATTRLVDQDNPAESPLLVMAARAHGSSATPPLTAGDAAALAAFREFVMLATGRTLPKQTKAKDPAADALRDLPGQVTPGRATFPASAADEPAPENKAAKVLNQTEAGWQAAIERQRIYDAEAQKLKSLEQGSQLVNEARGLSSSTPANMDSAAPVPGVVTPKMLPPQPNAPSASLNEQPNNLRNLPADAGLFDNDTAKAGLADQATTGVSPAAPGEQAPVVLSPTNTPTADLPPTRSPHALPESLLPKSLATKPSTVPEDTAPAPELPTGTEKPPVPGLAKLPPGASKEPPPPVKIDPHRRRRMFPLPPEDTPPPKGVGTGETKRR